MKKMKKINKKPRGKTEITKKMSFAEIMKKKPEAVEVLMKEGMHCVGCHMAMFETLEQGAVMHGIDPDKLVKKINNLKIKK